MDTKEAWSIKNRTKDTLLITLSQVDTLPDWQLWNEDLWKIAQSDRSSREETAFQIATIGNIAFPILLYMLILIIFSIRIHAIFLLSNGE